jgi:hypothetical protein
LPDLASIKALWSKWLTAKFLYFLCWIRCDDALVNQPTEESANRDEATIDRAYSLPRAINLNVD